MSSLPSTKVIVTSVTGHHYVGGMYNINAESVDLDNARSFLVDGNVIDEVVDIIQDFIEKDTTITSSDAEQYLDKYIDEDKGFNNVSINWSVIHRYSGIGQYIASEANRVLDNNKVEDE